MPQSRNFGIIVFASLRCGGRRGAAQAQSMDFLYSSLLHSALVASPGPAAVRAADRQQWPPVPPSVRGRRRRPPCRHLSPPCGLETACPILT
ncbi:hypothetical protein FJT64_007311 [Amphibalanus amphitrite]|uniref:Uncharacterized protein n=1 Tax=Amphibalanus amphitrite TaxID=1232801 RepID=A0A6A4VQH4_AMPAM|nr:hypothetical protein FJT64_007311 [Amphibalanus amphitrite]